MANAAPAVYRCGLTDSSRDREILSLVSIRTTLPYASLGGGQYQRSRIPRSATARPIQRPATPLAILALVQGTSSGIPWERGHPGRPWLGDEAGWKPALPGGELVLP